MILSVIRNIRFKRASAQAAAALAEGRAEQAVALVVPYARHRDLPGYGRLVQRIASQAAAGRAQDSVREVIGTRIMPLQQAAPAGPEAAINMMFLQLALGDGRAVAEALETHEALVADHPDLETLIARGWRETTVQATASLTQGRAEEAVFLVAPYARHRDLPGYGKLVQRIASQAPESVRDNVRAAIAARILPVRDKDASGAEAVIDMLFLQLALGDSGAVAERLEAHEALLADHPDLEALISRGWREASTQAAALAKERAEDAVAHLVPYARYGNLPGYGRLVQRIAGQAPAGSVQDSIRAVIGTRILPLQQAAAAGADGAINTLFLRLAIGDSRAVAEALEAQAALVADHPDLDMLIARGWREASAQATAALAEDRAEDAIAHLVPYARYGNLPGYGRLVQRIAGQAPAGGAQDSVRAVIGSRILPLQEAAASGADGTINTLFLQLALGDSGAVAEALETHEALLADHPDLDMLIARGWREASAQATAALAEDRAEDAVVHLVPYARYGNLPGYGRLVQRIAGQAPSGDVQDSVRAVIGTRILPLQQAAASGADGTINTLFLQLALGDSRSVAEALETQEDLLADHADLEMLIARGWREASAQATAALAEDRAEDAVAHLVPYARHRDLPGYGKLVQRIAGQAPAAARDGVREVIASHILPVQDRDAAGPEAAISTMFLRLALGDSRSVVEALEAHKELVADHPDIEALIARGWREASMQANAALREERPLDAVAHLVPYARHGGLPSYGRLAHRIASQAPAADGGGVRDVIASEILPVWKGKGRNADELANLMFLEIASADIDAVARSMHRLPELDGHAESDALFETGLLLLVKQAKTDAHVVLAFELLAGRSASRLFVARLMRATVARALALGTPSDSTSPLLEGENFERFLAARERGEQIASHIPEPALSWLKPTGQRRSEQRSSPPRKRGKRVLIVCGGTWLFVRPVAAALESAGMEVRFLSFSLLSRAVDEHVRRSSSGLLMTEMLFSAGPYLPAPSEVLDTVREAAPWAIDLIEWADTVFAEWWAGDAIWLSRYLPSDKRLIVRLHSFEAFSIYPHFSDTGRMDDVIFIAPHIREIFFAVSPHMNLDRTKTHYIPNLRDGHEDGRDVVKSGMAPWTLGMMQFNKKNKDPLFSLEVLDELLKRDGRWRLRLAGRGWDGADVPEELAYRERFERKLEALRDHVEMDGYVTDVMKWHEGIGFMLSTSHREGSHESVVEGMMAGSIPAIRTWPLMAPFGAPEAMFPDIPSFETPAAMADYIADCAGDFEALSRHYRDLGMNRYAGPDAGRALIELLESGT